MSKFTPFLIVALLFGFLIGVKILSKPNQSRIIINNQTIFVEMADNEQEISRGLSQRKSLAPDRGMLFVFGKPGNYLFWMKGMKFNLDFVFIRNDIIVDLVENVPYSKDDKIETVKSREVFDKVLEINAGKIRQIGIKTGDKIRLD